MENENAIRRGDVFFIDLDPTIGHEIGGNKARPVVVISINDIHQKTRLVAVVPGTTTESDFRNVAEVAGTGSNGLTKMTYFQGHQIRRIDQMRITSPRIGRLSDADFRKVEAAVKHSLGLIVA